MDLLARAGRRRWSRSSPPTCSCPSRRSSRRRRSTGSAPGCSRSGSRALLIGVSEGTDWGWSDRADLRRSSASPSVALVAWVAMGAARAAAARRHADDAPSAACGPPTSPACSSASGCSARSSSSPSFVQVDPAGSGFGFGASVTEAGVFLLPSALVMLFAGPLSGWLGTRYGSQAAAAARHGGLHGELRAARRRARRALGDLPRRRP